MPEVALGQLLVREGVVDESQLARAAQRSESRGVSLVSQLVELGLADEYTIARIAADACRLPFVELATSEPPSPEALALVPLDLASTHRCIPLWLEGDRLTVGVGNPLDVDLEEQLFEHTGMQIRRVVVRDSSIQALLEQLYASRRPNGSYARILADTTGVEQARKLVKTMLADALQVGGDLHIMPSESGWNVCLCVDDEVEDLFHMPASSYVEVAQIFKTLLGPQGTEGGEFTLRTANHEEVTFFLDIDRDPSGEQLFVCLIDRQTLRDPGDISIDLVLPKDVLAELETAARAGNMCIGSLIQKAWALTRDVVSTACVCPYTNPSQDKNATKVRLPRETVSDIERAAEENDRSRDWVVLKALLMARECLLSFGNKSKPT